jgi:transposase
MTYSIDTINLCFHYLRNNKTKKYTGETLEITLNTINRWIAKYKYNYDNKILITNETINNYKVQNRHKSIKRLNFNQQIIDYVNNNIGCSLKDIQINATNKLLSIPTVCRFLKELKITHKQINNYIVCKDINKIEDERKEFAKIYYQQLDVFNNLISIDESGFNIDDITNKGYSMKGFPINKLLKHKHNKKHMNLLMAISNNEVIAYKINHNSFNAEQYKLFLEENKSKFMNKQLLQDNVRFHHSRIVKDFAVKNNIIMKYIPAYSPIFNPIEMVFSKIKSSFRKLDHLNMDNDIIDSIKTITADNLKNYYLHVNKIINEYANK